MAKKDCSELAKTITELAMAIGSTKGVNTLDDVTKVMIKQVPGITRDNIVDAIVEVTERGPQEIEATIDTINRIKREARTDKGLQRKISGLETLLEQGQVPVTEARARRTATEAIESLRSIRDDLKNKIAQSEPGQKAKLEKQIAELEQRIKEDDFTPKIKPVETRKSKELERLEFERDQLRQEIRQRTDALKPTAMWEHIAEPFNVARAIMTSFDFSAVFRQGGIVLMGRPTTAAKSLIPMFRAMTSKQKMVEIHKQIWDRPNAPLYKKAKLFIAPIDGTHRLSKMEETYQTKWAEKIPGVAASERAYITFINKLRADTFDTLAAGLSKTGEVTLEEARALADYVNMATGRGTLGALEKAAVPLNTLFFAPRLTASRFQLLLGKPFFGGNNRTRKLIAKEYARYIIGMGVLYATTLFAFGDDDKVAVETDPRSTDFGKLRIGNTRLDPLSGLSQTVVLMSRLISGKTKSSFTGEVTPIRGKDVPFGRANSLEVLTRFLRNKLSPMFGTAANVITGEDFKGDPITLKSEAKNLLTPMAVSEVFETIKEQGVPAGTALSLMSIFGMGIMSYGKHYQTMTYKELQAEIKDNLYKRNGTREDGSKYYKNQPRRGKENYVKALRKERKQRSGAN